MSSGPPNVRFIEELKACVGPKGWVAAQSAGKYFTDPRDRFVGEAALVVMPSTTAQVSAVVALCNAHKIGVVPFGGGTGACAGHIDFEGQQVIVLSLEKMNSIRSIDVETDSITAEAGCILANIQKVAHEENRRFGLSLASEGSCTIGGNLASNAGGIQVLRYGNARDMCFGIEAVLPDGSILNDLRPLRKDNTGYDLRNLLIGSEGTLAIITAATLKLATQPDESATFMCALKSPNGAVALLRTLRTVLGETVTAFELMSQLGVTLATKHFQNLRDPFDHPHAWYAVVDVEGYHEITAKLEEVLQTALDEETIVDAVVAHSEAQRQSLWDLREFAFDYNMKEGAFCSSDTSVPTGEIEKFIRLTDRALAELDPDLRANRYGHVGDGNIHVNVFPPESISKNDYLSDKPDMREAVRMTINKTTEACGGSISAEHGIGRLKRTDLLQFADPTKLALMRTIKTAVDPNNIMNPGAVLLPDC
jgi:D-lactate dehydrogenase (cytochrome)